MSVAIRDAAGEDLDAALALRLKVFVEEQRVPLDEEFDGRDGEALHLVAVEDGEVVGTCRLLFDALPKVKLGRMVVAQEARGRGIAGLLLAEADERSRLRGGERMVLAAQLPAIPVYERAGYVSRGEVFEDAGIDHVWMEKSLA